MGFFRNDLPDAAIANITNIAKPPISYQVMAIYRRSCLVENSCQDFDEGLNYPRARKAAKIK
jgi:hypothetical protein